MRINIIDNEDGTIRINLDSSYEYNDSCSCHPEYVTEYASTSHQLDWNLIADDAYFSEYDECFDDHPYLIKYKKEIQEEAEEEKRKLEAKREQEEQARQKAKRERELREYNRLKEQFENAKI